MAIGKPECASFENLLTSGKLLNGWIKLEEIDEITIIQTSTRLSNEKALHALFQALSPSKFARISNCEIAKDAWQILETTYEGTKLVKSAKLQMLISKFE
jgi:hypothetical protein